MSEALKDKPVLGLWAREDVPDEPEGPSVACKVWIEGDEAIVHVASSGSLGLKWVPFGKFGFSLQRKDGTLDSRAFADEFAEGVLNRLVRAQLAKGDRVKGKPTYRVRIDNASPLVLNGLAISGVEEGDEGPPKQLVGIGIPPRRSMTVPATEDVVAGLGLKKGVRITAADLSGL